LEEVEKDFIGTKTTSLLVNGSPTKGVSVGEGVAVRRPVVPFFISFGHGGISYFDGVVIC